MEGQGPGAPGHPTPGSGDPSHHMPPSGQGPAEPGTEPSSEQATQASASPPQPPGGYTIPAGMVNWPAGARLTVPGNAEWALWFFVEILFAIIWASSDAVDASGFVIATAVITFAYLISRGIAKASRVLEQ
jgi:hypothetical protein